MLTDRTKNRRLRKELMRIAREHGRLARHIAKDRAQDVRSKQRKLDLAKAKKQRIATPRIETPAGTFTNSIQAEYRKIV